jgi:hypothetical protein
VSPPRHIGRRTTGVTAPARRKSSSLGLPVPARSSRPPRHRRSRPAACDKCRHRHVTAPDAVRPALNAPVRRTGSSGCGSRAEAGHETRRARLVGEPARDGACTGGSRRAARRRGASCDRRGGGRDPAGRRRIGGPEPRRARMHAGESGGHRCTSRLPDEPSLSSVASQVRGRSPPAGGATRTNAGRRAGPRSSTTDCADVARRSARLRHVPVRLRCLGPRCSRWSGPAVVPRGEISTLGDYERPCHRDDALVDSSHG